MLDCEQPSVQPPRGAIGSEGDGLFLGLVGAALARVNGVLEGMVRAGLGLEAISAYLGCARTRILDELAVRGLTLSEGQLNKPLRVRKNGWSASEMQRFICGWEDGVPVPIIAAGIGRTTAACYGKRPRIGLEPRRKRSTKPSIEVTKDAKPGGRARRTKPQGPVAADPPCPHPFHPATTVPIPLEPQGQCDAFDSADADVIGDTSPETTDSACVGVVDADVEGAVELAANVAANVQEPAHASRRGKVGKKSEKSTTVSRTPEPDVATAIDDFVLLLKNQQVYSQLDFAKIATLDDQIETAVRALGGQSNAGIAAAMAVTPTCIASRVCRLHITRGRLPKHAKFDAGAAAVSPQSLIPHACGLKKRLYFLKKGEARVACRVIADDKKRREKQAQSKAGKREAPCARSDPPWTPSVPFVRVKNNISLPRLMFLEDGV